jgi:hypothetical protein
LLATIPIGIVAVWRKSPEQGHTASDRAIWWKSDGALVCTNQSWAERLALSCGLEAQPVRVREAVMSPWMSAGIVLSLSAAPFFHWLANPLVRIINLTDHRLSIVSDGRVLGTVEPTSAESPAAGIELRLPAGRRRLVAQPPLGAPVFARDVAVQAGSEHLFAPGSDEHCFWLENSGYGRAKSVDPPIVPLEGSTRFWILPLTIDSWFARNPSPASADDRSTGGVMTALRHARCSEAPNGARDPEATGDWQEPMNDYTPLRSEH